MLAHRSIADSPLKHTYPYGRTDVVLDLGTSAEIRDAVATIFKEQPDCRRIVVPVPMDNIEGVKEAEAAGLHYVVDVTQRDGQDFSLMVAEPDWVASQSTEIDGLELK